MADTLQADVEKNREHWHQLASRATRVLMLRKGMSYREVAWSLLDLGVEESERSVEGKVHRGTFPFTFFLQVLVATKADCPVTWRTALATPQTWEQRASLIVQQDMVEQRWLTYDVLSRSLRNIGVFVPVPLLHSKMRDGTLSTALFLQYATVRRMKFANCFLDWSDLDEAAATGGQLFEAGAPVAVEPPVTRVQSHNPVYRRLRWSKRPPSR
jgi:hypothetical protein